MRPIVTHREQVAENIRTFQEELHTSQELQRRLGQMHSWYALKESEYWIFAPSKYVGYADNTAREYIRTAKVSADGGETEAILSQWFAPLEHGSDQEARLRESLVAFLAAFGRTPRRGARISVVSADAPGDASTARRADEALLDRISTNPAVNGGRPGIRGTRMRVSDILDMLASGATNAEILADYPYLQADDIAAALAYAARASDHRVIRVA
jgi:uncharacterized protein (DUF433 family)